MTQNIIFIFDFICGPDGGLNGLEGMFVLIKGKFTFIKAVLAIPAKTHCVRTFTLDLLFQ